MLHAGGWKKGKRGSAANLSRCLAARRRRGRSQRVRNSRGNCRPSATWVRVRLRLPAIGWPRSCSGCASSARSRAALSPSSIAGVRSERYPEIAAEFVRLKVDVITTQSTLAVLAAGDAAPAVHRSQSSTSRSASDPARSNYDIAPVETAFIHMDMVSRNEWLSQFVPAIRLRSATCGRERRSAAARTGIRL
jgi:hypothetical protein